MPSNSKLLFKYRGAIGVAAVASTASLLFDYDTGVAGSVVSRKSFSTDFEISSNAAKAADISSNIVASLNAGAFLGAVAPAILSRFLGRKDMMRLSACFLLLGGILQTAAHAPALSMIYGGRVISGFGVGMVGNFTPVYLAEIAPKQLRGLLMAFFETFLVVGGLLAYWTAYGCSLHLKPTSKQWRIPLSIQTVLGAIVLSGSFILIESPRWRSKQNRWDAAATALASLRGSASDESEFKIELAEMHAQIGEEIRATAGHSATEILQHRNFFRLLWGCGLGVCNIWCGQNAILYYVPTVFKQIGFTGQNIALFASGMFTVIKIALVHGMLFALGVILKTHPPVAGHASNNTPSGKSMMATIYMYIIAYSVTWGPLTWVYIGQIFPTRIRDYCMAITTMPVWFWNFVISKWTPTMFVHIGWKTWIIFGTMNAVGFVFTLFLPETKGLSLEEMDILFGVVDASTRRHDIEEYIGIVSENADNSATDEKTESN